jgi:hypothetical protein
MSFKYQSFLICFQFSYFIALFLNFIFEYLIINSLIFFEFVYLNTILWRNNGANSSPTDLNSSSMLHDYMKMDVGMGTSKNRMRAFRARRALVETAEQKGSRLAVDRQYRKQRLADFNAKKTDEEKQTHRVSRSQYEVKRLADIAQIIR